MAAKPSANPAPIPLHSSAQLHRPKKSRRPLASSSIPLNPDPSITKSLLMDFSAEEATLQSPLPSSPCAAATDSSESRSELPAPVSPVKSTSNSIEVDDSEVAVVDSSPPSSAVTTSSIYTAPAAAEPSEEERHAVQVPVPSDAGITGIQMREALSRVSLTAGMDDRTNKLLEAVFQLAIEVLDGRSVPDTMLRDKCRVGMFCALLWLLALFFVWARVCRGGESFAGTPPPT